MTIKIDTPKAKLKLQKKFMQQALRASARIVIKSAKSLIKTGAGISEPGDAPNSKTGNLLKSLKSSVKGMTATVSDNAYYALALESGAVGGGGSKGSRNRRSKKNGKQSIVMASTVRVLQPRPFLSTALEMNESIIATMLDDAAQKGIDIEIETE